MSILRTLFIIPAVLLTANTLLAETAPLPTASCCAAEKVVKAEEPSETPAPESPKNLSPKEILALADASRGNIGGVRWTIELTEDGDDSFEARLFDVKARGFDMVATTQEPAKLRNQKLLQVKNNMWFHKPGLSKPVRISPRQKLEGRAANGDIAATNYAEDYEVLDMADDTLNGTDCYLFELKAVSRNVTYSRIRYWVSKSDLVGIRAEYYTPSGEKQFKEAEMIYKNRLVIDGEERPFISEMLIRDTLQSDSVTRMSFSDPETGEISPMEFNLQALGRL